MFQLFQALLGPVFKVIDKVVPDLAQRDQIKGQLQMAAMTGEMKEVGASASIIRAEASGGWLQRNWRPILMLVIIVIVANNYLVYPYLVLFGVPTIPLELPDKLWTLMTIGVGGYIASRGGEKIVSKWKNPG